MKLTLYTTIQCTLLTMKVTSSWLLVWRPSADVMAWWDGARRHVKDRFYALDCWKVRRTQWNPFGLAPSGQWLPRLSLDSTYVLGFMARGSVQPEEEVSKVWMVNAGRMLSGGHWYTSWRSGPKRATRKESGPMTTPGQPLRIQWPLDLLDNWNSLDNWDPLDNRDPFDTWNPWLLSLPFALPQ